MGNVKVTPWLMIGLLNYVADKCCYSNLEEKEKRDKAKLEFANTLEEDLKKVFVDQKGKPIRVSLYNNFDYSLFAALLDAAVKYTKEKFSYIDDSIVCKDIGIKSAEKDFSRRLKLYTTDAYKNDPKLVLNATSIIWSYMYIGAEIKVTNFEQDKHFEFEISKFPQITKNNCIVIGSWIQKACEMIKGLEGVINLEHMPNPDVDCRIKFDVLKINRI